MSKKNSVRIKAVRETSIAMFQGTFAGLIGLGLAIVYSLRGTVNVAESTGSVIAGLAFGLAAGIISIIFLPMIYFVIGWVIGLVQGWVFNVIAANSGGIVVETSEE